MFMLFSRSQKDPQWGCVAPQQLKFTTKEEAEIVADRWRLAHPASQFEVREVTKGEINDHDRS